MSYKTLLRMRLYSLPGESLRYVGRKLGGGVKAVPLGTRGFLSFTVILKRADLPACRREVDSIRIMAPQDLLGGGKIA